MKYNYKNMGGAKLWNYVQKIKCRQNMLSPENNNDDNL